MAALTEEGVKGRREGGGLGSAWWALLYNLVDNQDPVVADKLGVDISHLSLCSG